MMVLYLLEVVGCSVLIDLRNRATHFALPGPYLSFSAKGGPIDITGTDSNKQSRSFPLGSVFEAVSMKGKQNA